MDAGNEPPVEREGMREGGRERWKIGEKGRGVKGRSGGEEWSRGRKVKQEKRKQEKH